MSRSRALIAFAFVAAASLSAMMLPAMAVAVEPQTVMPLIIGEPDTVQVAAANEATALFVIERYTADDVALLSEADLVALPLFMPDMDCPDGAAMSAALRPGASACMSSFIVRGKPPK